MLGFFVIALTFMLGLFIMLKVEKIFRYFSRSDKCCPSDNVKTNLSQKEGKAKVDLKSSSITADILNVLSDGKRHTMQEIADIVEVSEKTIRRHVSSLSYRFPIETFCGGQERGGVKLDKRYIQNGKIRTKEELRFIKEGLLLLMEREGECDALTSLLKEFDFF